MFNLKSAYFYFLAIIIIINKFIKKIYFSTKFYNSSLKTRIPNQFYFYPNPFLLSSFVNYKNFSFKISQTNLNSFWETNYSQKENYNLNTFFWLSLIDRKNNAFIIQKIISLWIKKNNKYKKENWDNSSISKRVISWILNADIILSNTNGEFRIQFLESIIIQINHLKKVIAFENNLLKKIEIISAIILSGLVFKEYKKNFEMGNRELKKIIDEFFDNDGCPYNRNINDLIKSSKFLVLIKECCKDAQEYVPDYLDDIVEKTLVSLISIKTLTKKNPLFNGANEHKMEDYFNYLTGLNYKPSKKRNLVNQIYILRNKKALVFFDIGTPPNKKNSSCYQCGPLSFEFFSNDNKIITNCGYGNQISKKMEMISRFTSAQSTLSLNDTSVIKFERNSLINNAFGISIKNSFKILNFKKEETIDSLFVSASHNAYENKFGYIHNRLIKINKKNNDLYGIDTLLRTKEVNLINKYNIRFHLYPGIKAVQTIGGSTILMQTQKNKSLIFSTNGEHLMLEKSIFLARNKIINNFCINISGTVNKQDKKITWEIKRNI